MGSVSNPLLKKICIMQISHELASPSIILIFEKYSFRNTCRLTKLHWPQPSLLNRIDSKNSALLTSSSWISDSVLPITYEAKNRSFVKKKVELKS